MRNQLDDLQRQLGTGKKSDDLCGPRPRSRPDGRPALAALRHLRAISRTITQVGVRLDLMQTALSQFDSVVAAEQELDPAVAVRAARRHPDPGPEERRRTRSIRSSACSTPPPTGATCSPAAPSIRQPVDTTDHILNGDGVKAGLKQVIDERRQADLGASGLGRLVVGAPTRDLGVADRGCRVAVRLQARRRDHDYRGRDRDPAGRRAGDDVGRSRRDQSEPRRHHQVQLHAAGRHAARI